MNRLRRTFLFLLAVTVGFAPALTHAAASKPHLAALRKLMPSSFDYVEEPPFVVVSDQHSDDFRQSTQTVRWALRLLKKDFFANDPSATIDIWLFKDKASYEKNVRAVFHEIPISPFGYYSPQHRALIMNISTGGGTLVHEMVHPFIRANFPSCPTWFDEGLASLFEACSERKGHIVGTINWRLPGLQDAIRAGKTLPFEKFTALTTTEFYGADSEYNKYYGQARYLCYYLQEQGLLIKFYREFAATAATDPTGYATLQRVLGVDDMPAFQKKWEAFVLALPPSK